MLLGACCCCFGGEQQPAIYPGGVVNAASFLPSGIVPGGIVSIFGQGLSAETGVAAGLPLPERLGGVRVDFDGLPGRLFFVSSGQINVQAPPELLDRGRTAKVTVRRDDGLEASSQVEVRPRAPGVFALDFAACGQGAVLNVDSSTGTTTINRPNNAARRGEIVSLFANGLGQAVRQPPIGEPGPSDPPSTLFFLPGALLGLPAGTHAETEVLFAGKAPGLVGVDQLNVRIPEDAPAGCGVPVTVRFASAVSRPVAIDIAEAGATCQPRGRKRFAVVDLIETTDSVGPGPTLTARAKFAGSEFGELPRPTAPAAGCRCGIVFPEAPGCDRFAPGHLDAGAVTIQGLGAASFVLRADEGGMYGPESVEGRLSPGDHRVAAAGGAHVDAFEADLTAPKAISLQVEFPPGSRLSARSAIEARWTGGDEQSVVVLEVASTSGQETQRCRCVVAADGGEARLEPLGPQNLLPIIGGDAQIAIYQLPRAFAGPKDPAGGLTEGAVFRWERVWRFPELTIR